MLFYSMWVPTIPDGSGAKYFSHCSSFGHRCSVLVVGPIYFGASLPHCGRPYHPSSLQVLEPEPESSSLRNYCCSQVHLASYNAGLQTHVSKNHPRNLSFLPVITAYILISQTALLLQMLNLSMRYLPFILRS